MAIEIEYRVQFSESDFTALGERLRLSAEDLGPDDKHTWFYVLPDKSLEVVHSVSRGTGKIVVKAPANPDIELAIAPADVPVAVRIFDTLGFAEYVHRAHNERRNWRYRGVEIATMWSPAWAYHAEFQLVLADGATPDEILDARLLVQSVADDLGVRLTTEEELVEFIRHFDVKQPETAGS